MCCPTVGGASACRLLLFGDARDLLAHEVGEGGDQPGAELVAGQDHLQRGEGAGFEGDGGHAPLLHVEAAGALGGDREAHAGGDEVLDRGEAAELGAEGDLVLGDAGGPEEVVGGLAQAAAGVAVDEGVGGEVAGGEPFVAGQRVAGAADHDQLFAGGDAGFDARVVGGGFDEADVHVAGGDAVLDVPRITHGDAGQHTGVLALEVLEDRRQPVAGNRRDAADVELAGEFASEFGDPGVELFRQVEDLLGVGQHELAGAGEADLAVTAFEQPGVEVVLELLDLEGDGGLRHVEVLGRPREGAVLGDGVEYLESAV